MLNLDLIVLVCNYLDGYNYYLLNKNVYDNVIQEEKNTYWRSKYEKYLTDIWKKYLILNGNYNWKREYLKRVKIEHELWIESYNEYLRDTIR